MHRYSRYFWIFWYCLQTLHAQDDKSLSLHFIPVFGNQNIKLGEKIHYQKKSDTLIFETFKFYLSSFKLYNSDHMIWEENNSFHLMDLSDEKSMTILINKPSDLNFQTLCFIIGIDSLTNVSGVFGGDLDPTNGMYWTWQSGYINIKMEGKSPHCLTRNHEFQFHLGGYQSPFNACQNICLDLHNTESHDISINLQDLFDKMDLATQNQIMSPGKNAYTLSQYFSSIFSVHLK